MLVDSGSSKHSVDSKLIREVESRMLEYTEMNPPMKIKAAGHNNFFGAAQGIVLVLVRNTQDVFRTIKLPIVLVPGLGIHFFLQQKKSVKNMFTKCRLHC